MNYSEGKATRVGWPRVRVARARLDYGPSCALEVAQARRFDQILNNVIIATRLISQVKERAPRELDFGCFGFFFFFSIKRVASFKTAHEDCVAPLVWLKLL